MIRGTKFSRLLCVLSMMSACGVPDAPSSRTPVVGQNQGADDTDCTSVTGQSSGAELLDTKVSSTDDAIQDADDSNCLPRKKPSVAAGKQSDTSGLANGNPQVAVNGTPASSNVTSNNSDGSPFSGNGLSGGLGGLASGLGGLGGLANGLGGLGGLAGGLGGLSGLTSGLGGFGGLLSGLTSGLGGLGNFGNLGSLFGGGGGGSQSSAGTGSNNNSAATNISNTPTTASGSITYSANVSPYLNRACVRCHSYLGNYDGAKRTASDSLNRMKSGNMPPGGGVSSSDLSQFQAWVTAGTPQ
jgi:hypothetical protein